MVANVIKVKTSNNSGPSCSKGGYYTTHGWIVSFLVEVLIKQTTLSTEC